MNRLAASMACAIGMICSVGCGGAQRTPESASTGQASVANDVASDEASSAASAEPAPADASGKLAVPTECHGTGDMCLPDPRWVKRLCQDVYPAVALFLFQASSPFTHGYLSRKTKAVNASGGATSGSEWLAFDEEVVLLYHRAANAGGIQVSGESGGFDAMRLDGSCVTLDGAEVRMEVPPDPKYTEVPWRYLGDDIEAALLQVQVIKDAYIARRKECKGAFSGDVSSKCVKLDAALNRAIIESLKDGTAKLPQPEQRP